VPPNIVIALRTDHRCANNFTLRSLSQSEHAVSCRTDEGTVVKMSENHPRKQYAVLSWSQTLRKTLVAFDIYCRRLHSSTPDQDESSYLIFSLPIRFSRCSRY
jgi:hypothetical protein